MTRRMLSDNTTSHQTVLYRAGIRYSPIETPQFKGDVVLFSRVIVFYWQEQIVRKVFFCFSGL
jgi:hypothetical protein